MGFQYTYLIYRSDLGDVVRLDFKIIILFLWFVLVESYFDYSDCY